jgi:hypothetical protein
MPTNFEFTRQTKANIADTMDFYTHPEFMTQTSPDFIKQVTIKSKDADTIIYEWTGEMMRRRAVCVNRLTINKDAHTLVTETIEGTPKGSRFTYSFKELPNGTEIKCSQAMEMGALGFLAKGWWKSVVEKTLDEEVKILDSKSSPKGMILEDQKPSAL